MSPTNFIDFHCHLDMKAFNNNRKEIVAECFRKGFSRLVTLADPYEPKSYTRTLEVLNCHPRVYGMAAAHPHNADKYTQQIEKDLLTFITDNNLIAVGEAGLDFHYNLSTPENQVNVFKRQIAIAQELKLPLVIHSREAEAQVLQALDETKFNNPVIFHCYTGSPQDARELMARGYYISFSGIVTFKKAVSLQEVAREVPLDRLFTETDSPYLAPTPFRGKTNSPLYVQYVAEKIAQLKEISTQEVNDAVNANFEALFKLP